MTETKMTTITVTTDDLFNNWANQNLEIIRAGDKPHPEFVDFLFDITDHQMHKIRSLFVQGFAAALLSEEDFSVVEEIFQDYFARRQSNEIGVHENIPVQIRVTVPDGYLLGVVCASEITM